MAKAKEPGNWVPVNERFAEFVQAVEARLVAGRVSESLPETVLAIDPGTTNLAVALIRMREGKSFQIDTAKFEIPKLSVTFAKIHYIMLVLETWCREKLGGSSAHLSIDYMVKESVAHGYPGGVADAGRVQHMLEYFATMHKIPWLDVTPQTMRKFIGSKAKSDTKLAVYKKFHVELPSEDECDAFAIGMTGVALFRGELTKPEKKSRAKKPKKIDTLAAREEYM